jgi:hypothetical protein
MLRTMQGHIQTVIEVVNQHMKLGMIFLRGIIELIKGTFNHLANGKITSIQVPIEFSELA